MDPKEAKVLNEHLPELVEQVNPQQILPYLPCLSTFSKETIDTAQSSKSRSYAVQILHQELIRKEKGFQQLVEALRHPSIDSTKLADELTQSLEEALTGGSNQRRHNASGCDVFWSRSMPSRQRATDTNSVSPGIPNRQSVSHNATGQQSGATGMTTDSRSEPPISLRTPWSQLKGVRRILKKFDFLNSMKKPEDLADLFGFNNEQIQEIKSQVLPGDSFTLAIIIRQAQREKLTLGDIYRVFSELDRVDILEELQETTGVRFTRPETRQNLPDPDRLPQAEGRSIAAVRNEEAVNNKSDPNVNRRNDKPITYKKLDTAGEKSAAYKQISVGMPQNHSSILQPNIKSIDLTVKNGSKINEQPTPDSVEDNSQKILYDRGERFNGYKPEEIIKTNAGEDPEAGRNKEPEAEKLSTSELYGHLDSREMFGSSGFKVNESQQNMNDRCLEVCKNDLDRSDSTSSSNTENSTYDSLTGVGEPKDLNSGERDESKMENDIDTETKKEEGAENISNRTESEHKSREIKTEDELNTTKSKLNCTDEQSKPSEDIVEVDSALECSEYFHHSGSIQNRTDVNSLEAKFYQRMFEMNLENENISDILSGTASSSTMRSLDRNNDAKNRTKVACKSLENYIDYSLEHDRIDVPKLSIGSQELNSIGRKAAKPLPGDGKLLRTQDSEGDDIFEENPSGSFVFDWDDWEEKPAVSSNGEVVEENKELEGTVRTFQPCDHYGKSDVDLSNQTKLKLQVNEFTRRGGGEGSILDMPENLKRNNFDDSDTKKENVVAAESNGPETVKGNKKAITDIRSGTRRGSGDTKSAAVVERYGKSVKDRDGKMEGSLASNLKESVMAYQNKEGVMIDKEESVVNGYGNGHAVVKNRESEDNETGTDMNQIQTEAREERFYYMKFVRTVLTISKIVYDNCI